MRLIDADELLMNLCASCRYRLAGTCLGEDCDADDICAVREAKTVEAIPLEWLTKRMIEELDKSVLLGGEHNVLAMSLWNVVEYWKREAKA